jgi:hypothetical protein
MLKSIFLTVICIFYKEKKYKYTITSSMIFTLSIKLLISSFMLKVKIIDDVYNLQNYKPLLPHTTNEREKVNTTIRDAQPRFTISIKNSLFPLYLYTQLFSHNITRLAKTLIVIGIANI